MDRSGGEHARLKGGKCRQITMRACWKRDYRWLSLIRQKMLSLRKKLPRAHTRARTRAHECKHAQANSATPGDGSDSLLECAAPGLHGRHSARAGPLLIMDVISFETQWWFQIISIKFVKRITEGNSF